MVFNESMNFIQYSWHFLDFIQNDRMSKFLRIFSSNLLPQ